MKKLYFCDQCNKILPKGEIICDRCGFENTQIIPELSEDLLRDERRRKKLRKLCIVGVLILLFVADNFIFPPAWWRFERQADKNAIVDYVSRYYPKNTKRVGFSFPLQFPAAPHQASAIYYELDGVKFHVAAEKGRIVEDTYMDNKVEKQFDEIIMDKFINPRGIKAGIMYRFKDKPYYYPYKGNMSIWITVDALNPKDAGWLYDFYLFWKKEGEFLDDYTVQITVGKLSKNDFEERFIMTYTKDKVFFNEKEYYSSYKWCGV